MGHCRGMKMFYLGPAGNPIECRSTEEGIKKVAELGLNAMEVQFVRGTRMEPSLAAKLGKLASSLCVKLSCHAPYFINLNSRKKETVERSKLHILKTAEIASTLGARVVTVHAGYYSGKASAAATEVIRKGVEECAIKITEKGWDVLIGLETMGRRATWGTLDEIIQVCRGVKNVVPVLDFSHIHARCGGCFKKIEDFDKVLQRYETINPKFLHSHFTSIEFSDKGERRHLTMDESDEPPFEFLAKALKKRNYDITIISESPVLEKDSLRMKRILSV